MLRHTQTLSENWEWKQRDLKIANLLDELKAPSVSIKEDSKDTRSTWRKANTSPSEIHTELLKAGLIPDPYKGFNEHKVQWVGKREWLYRTTFELSQEDLSKSVELEFEGLDTFCTGYLNDVEILKSDNMFTTNIVPLAPISVDTPPQSKSIVNSIQAVVSTLSLTPKPQVKHALKPGANTLLLHFK
ncbi:beta-mannosidase [Rhizoctonia solani AG-1 IB]|nr:beta-mannosidase [Rhizoctonia solani AG-1 IB]